MNEVLKCIVNSFYETIPHSRVLVNLTIIDDIILIIHGNDIENKFENIHEIGKNILYMLLFEKKMIKDEQQTIRTTGDSIVPEFD